MSILIRAFAWLLAAAVTFATLGPPGLRPHSDLGQDGEHAFAFILVGLAFGLAYRQRRPAVAAISVVLIGLLELMQFWSPGRHARLEDFVVDAVTACIGFALAAAADWVLRRLRPNSVVTSEGPAE
ncbi:VanZ family protein [Bradyrhizobium diazoefficiens]|uniref:VanZ family protein n=1 Tax=Bradyrhizobium diazoefficiens TaxID=1355477 RepID=UPI00190DAF9A|nr:VanZ family protein [Bradyrhizobium diazoefficiens]MBK3664305.1 VanZ family protein [Bradyrhizobium diazoefficiens]